MTVKHQIDVAVEKVFKWTGHPPKEVVVGFDLKQRLLEEAKDVAVYLAPNPSTKALSVNEQIASQYIGIPVRFVPWMDGVFARPEDFR